MYYFHVLNLRNSSIMVQAGEQLVSTDAERYLLIYMIAVLVIVTGLVILFFMVFQKRKNKLLMDKIQQEREFEEALIKTQTEIQEQTLKNIGQELHDNVGQLLSMANMQLSLVATLAQDSLKSKVDDLKEVISDSISEVRSLSKVLNSDVILNFGLEQSIQNELNRLNRLKLIEANLHIQGVSEVVDSKDAIILFRIVQEFISNSIKYSEAKSLRIDINYLGNHLELILQDSGKGFDIEKAEKGSGLINMKSRAKLLDTEFDLSSTPTEGTILILRYNIVQRASKKNI